MDRITRDQVEDYARRKGMKIAEIERRARPRIWVTIRSRLWENVA